MVLQSPSGDEFAVSLSTPMVARPDPVLSCLSNYSVGGQEQLDNSHSNSHSNSNSNSNSKGEKVTQFEIHRRLRLSSKGVVEIQLNVREKK